MTAALTDQEELFELACKLISFDNKSHKRNIISIVLTEMYQHVPNSLVSNSTVRPKSFDMTGSKFAFTSAEQPGLHFIDDWGTFERSRDESENVISCIRGSPQLVSII